MIDYKVKIIEELDTLRKKELQDKQIFKARAYAKVIGQLQAYQCPVRVMEDLANIEGIGEKIRGKIEEILATGTLEQANKIRKERKLDHVDMLMKVYGIGPVKAKDLIATHKITSYDQLRSLVDKEPSVLNAKQKIGLKYVEDLSTRIPRSEMEQHEKLLKDVVPKGMTMEVVGSYRRGAATSGDIDVLLCAPKMNDLEIAQAFGKLCAELQDRGYITDILALGPKKCMGVCKIAPSGTARRIDLLMTPKEEYPYALLYFTGSDKFNVGMRKHALEKGYTMNEHGMKAIKPGVPSPPASPKSEKDIFEFLDISYVPPKERDNKKNL